MNANASYINSCIGRDINISPSKMCEYLSKMGMPATISDIHSKETEIVVQVPVTRSDILHACDIMEDVAVAYGINSIPKTIPSTNTVGGPFPLNKLSDLLRREVAFAGWTEVLPLTLVRYLILINICNKSSAHKRKISIICV